MNDYFILVAWYTSGPTAGKPFCHHILKDHQLAIDVGDLLVSVGAVVKMIEIKLPI